MKNIFHLIVLSHLYSFYKDNKELPHMSLYCFGFPYLSLYAEASDTVCIMAQIFYVCIMVHMA